MEAAIREAAQARNHPPDLINVALERIIEASLEFPAYSTLDEFDEFGDTARWLEGVAPAKVADFAGETATQDVDTLSRYGDGKKLALVACLVHTARMQARDDLAEMLCKRVASIVKKAKTELEEIRLRQRAVPERLIGTYRTVLEHLDPDGEAAGGKPGRGAARAVAAVEEVGGFVAQLSDIDEVSGLSR